MKTTDVLIIGTGLAGTYVALNLPTHLEITMMCHHSTNSTLAQGGIAISLDQKDSFEAHIEDTLTAGRHTNKLDAVKTLIENAPYQIQTLKKLGVEFDYDAQKKIHATLEGGHSYPRVIHAGGDQTGQSVMSLLDQKIESANNIQILKGASLLELVIHDQQAIGIVYEMNETIQVIYAKHIVMATGGLGDLYTHTTNQEGSTGEAIAIAAFAGAKCQDMRYIQFHPTAYKNKDKGYFLITEAIRGVGAYLLDAHKNRFMDPIHPLKELAPRDIVSKAIYDVIASTQEAFVYLDTRHLKTKYLKERFPNIYKTLEKDGLTLGVDLVPVTPVAHYAIGGICTDLMGRTNLMNLYACGEVASTGVHGANRLASNSLLECLVFGKNVAEHIVSSHEHISLPSITKDPLDTWKHTKTTVSNSYKIHKACVQEIMTKYVGIVRYDHQLKLAKSELIRLLSPLKKIRFDHVDHAKSYNLVSVSLMVVEDALNHESLGCHYKEIEKKGLKSCKDL
ncbi:L-aspartate oxidase [Petrocella sp. FN5]|uniref:L-aspartate oxidase n=1 Tax=Petrocella sp. FN5 TaxID=3032002 RepID=UPI0023DA1CEB|nr:L-aspartate oxidase [Petrocella sp. FN5]MDF1617004.1 L-aspartate oxidase [Petrocella sp. FN5]